MHRNAPRRDTERFPNLDSRARAGFDAKRAVKSPGMRVRFSLGRSAESGARDLSFAESCAHGLRSQVPVSSVCLQVGLSQAMP